MDFELRKWRLSDARDLAAVLSNKNILNNLRDGLPYPYTEQDAAEYINAMLSADEKDTFAYAITVAGKAVGSIGAFRQSNIHSQTAELGYYLDERLWGQGIMSEAIRRICDIIFDTTDILRIFAEPFSYNVGSCRALEKAGFALEGTMKNNAVKNGKALDMRMYSKTRDIQPFAVKRIAPERLNSACALALEVFNRFEAPEYSAEGIAEFNAFLNDSDTICRMPFYGAFDGGKLVGVLAMRQSQHISLFFVKEDYHRRGIGRLLFDSMRQDCENQTFTVNSSPYAVGFYERLGFIAESGEQITNGIRYTPMRFAK